MMGLDASNTMKMLNLGCGNTCHPAWVNIDMTVTGPGVIAHDLRTSLPFSDDSFDVVYHSHVLEHLTPDEAVSFLMEAVRVLKPGGLMRVVVPDIEQIARHYLSALDAACQQSSPAAEADYDWMVIELLDQISRSDHGGQMARYLRQSEIQNRTFVRSRVGHELDAFENPPAARLSIIARLFALGLNGILRRIHDRLLLGLVRILGGSNAAKHLLEGRFRNSGEVHKWMYDRFSLGRLMANCGLVDLCVCLATESKIPNFASFCLDVVGSETRKPDSLFMEGIKLPRS